jgi:diguanylate cyclase (GGDEF)-like protein
MLLVGGLAWMGMETGLMAGHAPAVWWANAALTAVLLLDADGYEAKKETAARKSLRAEAVSGARTRNWPILLAAAFVGDVIAHLLLNATGLRSAAISTCDIAEAAIAAYGMALACRGRFDLTRQDQLIRFVVIAVLLAPMVAGSMAAVALNILDGSPLAAGLAWFPPSALGMSIVPPLVLGLARRETWELFHTRRLVKTLIYLALIVGATAAIFLRSEFALLFLVIPPLLLLVLRLGIGGGALGCVLIALTGTNFIVVREGTPGLRIDYALEHRIVLLQLFLATTVLSVSVVGVVLEELKRAGREVQESEMRYRSLAASMEMLASIDPLTHLANRRRFDEALLQEWQRAMRTRAPLSLVLFDADYFKSYNDCFGHIAGDTCLRKIADKMSETARRPADLVARFGGEEFAVLLPHTPLEGARMLAEQIRKLIEEMAFPLPASPAGVLTLSGGCATGLPGSTGTPLDLLDAADAALYEAKRNGRNRIESAAGLRPLARAE